MNLGNRIREKSTRQNRIRKRCEKLKIGEKQKKRVKKRQKERTNGLMLVDKSIQERVDHSLYSGKIICAHKNH